MRQLVETDAGVYQPMQLNLATATPFLVLLATVLFVVAGRIPFAPTVPLFVGYGAIILIPPLFERWKYGKLGKPAIALLEDSIFLALPNDSRGHLSIPLENLLEVIVYGPEGRRTYRFIRGDGTFTEACPMWTLPVETAIIKFIEGKISSVTRVTVKEPQLLFSYIRGDGP